jgi:beta-galactosidase
LLFSYENLWALELNSKPAQLDAWEIILPWYQALLSLNVPLDIVTPEADFSRYQVLLAPHLYQLTQTQAAALTQFVANGGTLILTYFSGIVDTNEQIWLGGYPALLQDLLGLMVEEWQPLLPMQQAEFKVVGEATEATSSHWVDLLHTTTAETLAVYSQDFYAGRPAITRNRYGSGLAYYVGTRPERPFLTQFFAAILQEQGIEPLLQTPTNVEVGLRQSGDRRYLFLINHGDGETAVDLQSWRGIDLLTGQQTAGQVQLPPYGVMIVVVEE